MSTKITKRHESDKIDNPQAIESYHLIFRAFRVFRGQSLILEAFCNTFTVSPAWELIQQTLQRCVTQSVPGDIPTPEHGNNSEEWF